MVIAAAIIVRNEARSLPEWFAYHAAIGIGKFVVYDNESTDGTVATVLDAARLYDIDLVPWPTFSRRTTQIFAYRDACFRLRTQSEVEWCAFLDSDEYLLSTTGADIRQLTDRCAAASSICLNWAVFGSSGHVMRPPGLMIEEFCRRAPLQSEVNNLVKSIVRPQAVLDCANPHFFYVSGACVDPTGEPAAINASENGTEGVVSIHDWRINHYAAKSQQQWAERIKRGQCGQIPVDTTRWLLWDRNDEQDISAHHFYGAATRQQLDRYYDLDEADFASRDGRDKIRPQAPSRIRPYGRYAALGRNQQLGTSPGQVDGTAIERDCHDMLLAGSAPFERPMQTSNDYGLVGDVGFEPTTR